MAFMPVSLNYSQVDLLSINSGKRQMHLRASLLVSRHVPRIRIPRKKHTSYPHT